MAAERSIYMTIEETEQALGRKLTRYEKGAISIYNKCMAEGKSIHGSLRDLITDLMLEAEERSKYE